MNPEAEININEVYFVPRLWFNLLSVRSNVDMGYTLVFDDKRCTIYHNNNVVGNGIRDGKIGFYIYLVSQPKFSISAITSILVV